jgi:hypothetical protein
LSDFLTDDLRRSAAVGGIQGVFPEGFSSFESLSGSTTCAAMEGILERIPTACGETSGVAANYIEGQDVDIRAKENFVVDGDILPAVKPSR